jgi:hypothetical protein
VADQQVHRPADLPQNIAKEVTLFAADLVDHLPQRRRAGGVLTVQPACLG